ncbi:Uncharacterised protein [Burkholderia pseudomallei]|uniref:hypothetical protein n=1 Tax=Burkholderia pseudomallei TaxID=28450 RepID=UPI000F15A3D7|nr:hypothetical protein [Burkholderia pseudomallei]VBT21801.1 Uncharacterised protein [Burkholderia pseudomallei]
MSDTDGDNNVQDWRLQATTELAEDANLWGTLYPKGTVLKQAANLKLSSAKTLTLSVPNATALFLSSSHRAYTEAAALMKKSKIASASGPNVAWTDDDAFTWLEHMMTSIISAYTAVEAFVNQSIPDDFQLEKTRSGAKETLNKLEIERRLPLKEKLSDVLPVALNIKKPVGHTGWDKFCRLEGMRDRIIHMKSKDQNVMGEGKGTVWDHLLTFPEPVRLALPLLDFLASQMKLQRRWVTHRPF